MRLIPTEAALLLLLGLPAPAVEGQHQQHQGGQNQHQGEDEPAMGGPLGIGMSRDGSGTSWLPDLSPMYALHRESGSWDLMLHGNLFLQYVDESGARGDEQLGSIHWLMAMGERELAGGRLGLRTMMSLEPWTVSKCGYPDLLATGERCNGEPLHDRQHPHDLFMELAAFYRRELRPNLAYEIYGGLSGEPALGPTAFPHRISAMPNALAPMSHHWLDSTHISFGVLTGGFYQRKWKLEGSAFNGREPDDERFDLDVAPLDSYSGRFWWLPTEEWALQMSAGHLEEAELLETEVERVDVRRVTASATYHRRLGTESGFWATTAAWGRNTEERVSTDAFLVESNVSLDARNSLFGRAEVTEKTGEELVVSQTEQTFTIGKLQAGYVRYLGPFASLTPGIGASVSLSFVPEALAPPYDRTTLGVAVFLTIRPAEMISGGGSHGMADEISPP